MANVNSPNDSDVQYYMNYFQQEYGLHLSENEISDILIKNEPELVFPELVRLAEIKKKKEEIHSEHILTDNELDNCNLQQANSLNNKNKKTVSLSVNFHGFNVNAATMYSRRILYDVDENRNYKIFFNVGRGSHSDGKEKLRPEIEQVIRCINEKTNININQETSRNPGIIALEIEKHSIKK